MSIQTEITRLNGIKNTLQSDQTAIANAITEKGVTVPSGSGFDDFAGLISDISEGYKAVYITDQFSGVVTQRSYNLEIEPMAVLIKCNENVQTVYNNLTVSTTRPNTLAILSGFKTFENLTDDFQSAVPCFIWVKKTASSQAPELASQNNGNFVTKTQNAGGGWTLKLGANDAGSSATGFSYRLVLDNGNLQIFVVGK